MVNKVTTVQHCFISGKERRTGFANAYAKIYRKSYDWAKQ